ncbi:tape measure protein [Escherichia coli]|nr:tape measure protein [Escherichia coli]
MAVKEVGRFVNTIHWQSDNSWQKELQRIKKYKKTVESAHEQIAKTQYRASAGMIKAQQAQARAQEKIRKAALAAQMRSQKQLQTLEKRMAREQARHNKLMSGVVSGRSMAKQRTITTMSGMRNMFSTATLNKYRASLQRLNAQYASGGMSVSMYNQKLAALRNEMRATEASARRLGATIKGAFKGAGSKLSAGVDRAFNAAMMGTAAAGGLTKVAMDNSANRNSAYYGLMAMNKDDKAATDDQMKFIRNVSNAHGMDQKTAETGYMQWAASTKNMTENDRRALFEAMAIKGRSTGATGEKLQRAQVALSQMAGKNQVMSEELKGQLSEALPGSQADFQEAYAKSIGKETVSLEEFNKAMEDGDVQLQKILPHLVEIWQSAKNTRAYAEAMKQPEMAMQRLKNAAYNASIAMFGQIDATDGVYTLAELIDDTAQHLTATLEENKGEIEAVGAGIAAFFARIQYGLGWFYEACKPILEFFGVDTKNAKEVGDFLGKAVLFFGALKAIKSVVGLLEPFATGFTKLIKAIVKGAELLGIEIPKPGKNKGPGKTTNKTGNSGGKGAVTAAIGEEVIDLALNDKYQEKLTSSTDPMDQVRSKTGQTVTQRVETGDMGLLLASGIEVLRNSWNAAKTVPGKVPTWLGGTPRIPTAPTVNTAQAAPAPSTGFNGAVPSQVMVESSGDINAQFQVTVDENGLLRVVQKEVETAIGWEKTKEINMFAVGG